MTLQSEDMGKLVAGPTDWKIGDLAMRLEDHALVRAGEVHEVVAMYRGGYLGFAGRVGGEWNPNGWRKVEKGSVAHEIEMSVVRTTLRNAIIPPATSCGTDCDCTAECERDFSPAHREAQPETDGGGEAVTCQSCGGEIQGWNCQGCGAIFRENDAGVLVREPTPEGQTGGAEVIDAARAYFDGWMQDEADDGALEWVGCSKEQHLAAKRLKEALAALASKGV